MKEDQSFFVGQKAFIRKEDAILILGNPEGLDFPGGKIQVDETDTIDSLKREVREETTLEIKACEPFITWTGTFPTHHENNGKKLYLVGYRCEYVSGEVTLSDEHDSFSWVTKENYHGSNDGTEYFEILEKYFEE